MAVLAKVNWFLSTGAWRPFVNAGLGAGTIRQVVKINVHGGAEDKTGCGDTMNDTCVDTVTGGPIFLVVGGGVAYEIGRLLLLGSLSANVGIPQTMINLDATLGLGFRLR